MFFKKKGSDMLDLLPIQWDDEAAIAERASRQEAADLLKDMMGDRYLLHPSNMIERRESRTVLDDFMYGQNR